MERIWAPGLTIGAITEPDPGHDRTGTARKSVLGQRLGGLIAFALLGAGLLIDHMPRFYQGDSLSYLSTGEGWMPPDRSWAFGLAVAPWRR
jgi:hypothetical protein